MRMRPSTTNVLAIFLSLFALDVFKEGYSVPEAVLAFLIHLIPTYIIALFSVIAWRWELVGGALFIVFPAFYVVLTWGRAHWGAHVALSAPMVLIGALFILNWTYRKGTIIRP